ncbi:hypothetical protein TNCV_1955731 [Trichonephila clavipes]|nr:hypothetical protein TNCV_1955731 [Trichonephila clavipes]
MEEIADLARKINLEVYSNDFQELLDFHNQDLRMDELTERHMIKSKTLKNESLDPVQPEDRMMSYYTPQFEKRCSKLVMSAEATTIHTLRFFSIATGVSYKNNFRWPHKKKSKKMRSVERGSQTTSPPCPIHFPRYVAWRWWLRIAIEKCTGAKVSPEDEQEKQGQVRKDYPLYKGHTTKVTTSKTRQGRLKSHGAPAL